MAQYDDILNYIQTTTHTTKVNGGDNLTGKATRGGRGTLQTKLDWYVFGLHCHTVGDSYQVSGVVADTLDTHSGFMKAPHERNDV